MYNYYHKEQNLHREVSMVIPRSHSAFSLPKPQAYLKEPLSHLGSYRRVLFDPVTCVRKWSVVAASFPNNDAEINLLFYHSGLEAVAVSMTLVFCWQTHCKTGMILWQDSCLPTEFIQWF